MAKRHMTLDQMALAQRTAVREHRCAFCGSELPRRTFMRDVLQELWAHVRKCLKDPRKL